MNSMPKFTKIGSTVPKRSPEKCINIQTLIYFCNLRLLSSVQREAVSLLRVGSKGVLNTLSLDSYYKDVDFEFLPFLPTIEICV